MKYLWVLEVMVCANLALMAIAVYTWTQGISLRGVIVEGVGILLCWVWTLRFAQLSYHRSSE